MFERESLQLDQQIPHCDGRLDSRGGFVSATIRANKRSMLTTVMLSMLTLRSNTERPNFNSIITDTALYNPKQTHDFDANLPSSSFSAAATAAHVAAIAALPVHARIFSETL